MRCGTVLSKGTEATGTLREAVVIQVLGRNAGPPFLVRWLDTGRTSVLYPDNDVWIKRHPYPHLPGKHGSRCG